VAWGGQARTDVRQIPLAIGPAPLKTFDNFDPGQNAAAVSHLRTLSAHPGTPVYLWGVSGSGKSHLLTALTHDMQAGWFDSATPLPWTFNDHWSLIVLDGCEALDEAQQQAAFALFIDAASHDTQVAASGNVPPVDLPLRDDLRTRLGWGHVFAIEPLGENEACVVLCQEADRRGIPLSDDVMSFLMTRFSRDLKHLMALLDRLDEFALAEHRAVTVPLLKKLFEEEGATL
jgi:DnaA-homolog protein